jgi:hypothetical protein
MNGNVSVGAAFTLNPSASYAITASARTGGSISPSGSVSVASGASKTFTITPKTGYRISRVIVDGTWLTARSSYTFTNVRANHSIVAYFARHW